MRIVIDMQGAQSESRFRGIGRYTMDFARAVVCNRGEHEIILALSGLLPDSIEQIRAAFDGILPQENIRVWYAPGQVKEVEPGNGTRREVAELVREAFLESLCPDVIHVTSLFEGYVDDAVTSIGRLDSRTPVSVSLYDLIPLLNPDQYLKPNQNYATYYERKLKSLKQAAVYLAISEHAKQEGLDCLGVDAECFENISTAIAPDFQVVEIDASTSTALCNRLGLNRPFVLYTGGADERKNLPRLIEAWAKLPAVLQESYQLLLAGRMPDGSVEELRRIAQRNGLQNDELLFSGYVSDDELVQLYNLCKLYVFPSWHEGFGLPALEAMACGAPVIAANASSLPEVIGLQAALFDPFDVAAISQKMEHVLGDEVFRLYLRNHGLMQAKNFSWDKTAKSAIRSWEAMSRSSSGEGDGWRHTSVRLADTYNRLVNSIARLALERHADVEVELQRIAVNIEKNERELDCYLRPRSLPDRITWRIEGPFDSSYSLALVNREIARALALLGHRVVLHSTEGPGDFIPDENILSANVDLKEMYQHSFKVAHIDADVVSRNLYPPRVQDMEARFNFLHAYGWEESGFPQEWVDNFNLSLQGMTVMSEHVRKIMVDHGVTVPIEVCSLGVDHWHRIDADNKYQLSARSFRFLHVSSCFPRKGVDVMLRAYGRAFSNRDDVTLVIKTFPNPHNEIYRWLDEARSCNPVYPDVLVIEEDCSDEQLKALYEQCHVLVAPSRAEGFGLPLAEAMLSGLAVITTGWGGQMDFCTKETSWLIDYSFARAKTHFGLTASVWAEPDEMHLAELMREVYALPEESRQIRIAAGRQLLEHKFRWSDAATRMVESAQTWAKGRCTAYPHIGWVTTWNTRCGIAAYSEHLINNISSDVTILAAQTHEKTANDGSNVLRCWSVGEDDTLNELSESIRLGGLDTLVIQFNYGFFDLNTFASFLDEQIENGVIVIVIMHATIDPVHVPHKKLSLLRSSLMNCHRILVHTPHDMNRLKQLGVVDNVTLFPHGLIDFNSSLPHLSERDEFVISSYGFFLPHKGLLELIDAIAIMRDRGINVRLNMINAEYPAAESIDLITKARGRIESKRLGDYVSMCTDYLTDKESIEELSKADLIVFPYQVTGESSSAAVRYGIASGKPVAVTPLSIFDDVAQAVHMLPGITSTEIAEGIAFLVNGLSKYDEDFRELQNKAERWRAEHRYSSIGPRLNQILIAIHGQESQRKMKVN
ncbi:glycosyltransferase [Vibrio cholerae]|uniref:glycosyltransferase n=1 Tax=Vibrio cholerae TaxID=666 RepID=UPI00206C7799|nr:glycosyltransferase [Vibrio cholerae]MDA5318614.1 glycosyltransferase [Vibrio cholerae]BCN19623.1 putative glycosyltransferase [Vibrio cholerae]GHX27091.1 glycosyl transferases group 1 family protein [Vibrio cholerae]